MSLTRGLGKFVFRDRELQRFANTITEIVGTWKGDRKRPLEKVVTVRDLKDLGIVEGLPTGDVVYTGGTPGPPGEPATLDPTTPSTPSGLAAAGAWTNVILDWDLNTDANYAYMEIWRATSDNLGAATRVGTSLGNVFTDAIGTNQTKYYWIRAVNTSDIVGPYNATAGTVASTAKVDTGDVADGAIETLQIGLLAVDAARIADAAITALKVANAAINSAHIANAQILSAHIANANILAAHIANAQIQSAHIVDANVGTLKIKAAAVTATGSDSAASDEQITDSNALGTAWSSWFTTMTTTVNAGDPGAIVDAFVVQVGNSVIDIRRIIPSTWSSDFEVESRLVRSDGANPSATIGSIQGVQTIPAAFNMPANMIAPANSASGNVTYYFQTRFREVNPNGGPAYTVHLVAGSAMSMVGAKR